MIGSYVRSPLLAAALAVSLSGAVAGSAVAAELKLPRPSPKAVVTQTIGLTDFTVTYSRPGVKGRKIWGGLVPYGEVWRTGANESTSLTLSGEATIGGKKIPAGEYSLYTLPGEKEWTVIVSTEKGAWGSYTYAKEKDAHRFTVKPSMTAPHEEWMRFSFENLSNDSGELVLHWEKMQLPIPIQVATHEQAMAGIRAAMAEAKPDDQATPFRAAQYLFNVGADPDQALKWAEQSVSIKPTYFNLSLLADIQMKAGKTKDAITAAERAIKVGKEDPDKPDTRGLEAKLAEWKGKS